MIFERSPEGIANRAIFLNVDLVAYHESEKEESLDGVFWSSMFQRLAPAKRITFLPSGSRSQIRSIYERFTEANSSGALFLMDRDGDEIESPDDPRVILTFGYSYENDIVSIDSVADIIMLHCINSGSKESMLSVINTHLKASELSLNRLARVDRLLRGSGLGAVARKNYRNFLGEKTYGRKPYVDRVEFVALVNSARKRRAGAVTLVGIDPDWRLTLLGHFVFAWFFQLSTFIIHTHASEVRLRKIEFKRMLISLLVQKIDRNEECQTTIYYKKYLSSIT
jgi:hypothetical protein